MMTLYICMQNTYHEGTYYLCEVHDGMKRVHNLVNFGGYATIL